MHHYRFRTTHGLWTIARHLDGRWHPALNGESLGSYTSARTALDDLTGGHTFWPPPCIDPSTVGLPEELSGWTRHVGQWPETDA